VGRVSIGADTLELAIGSIPYFRELRPDERARVMDHARTVTLEPLQSLPLGPDTAVVLVVLEGEVTLVREGIGGVTLDEGDWSDDLRALTGKGRPGTVAAHVTSKLALLDQAAFDRLFEVLPVVAVPLLSELGREAQRRNDLTREIALARGSGLPPAAFKALVTRRRRRMHRHRHVAVARVGALLWRALVVEPSRRLAFWMFLGAFSALVVARTVVAVIIERGLQKSLFALISSNVGHPIHVHHFNYGLITVAVVGLLAFLPRTRRRLRTLATAFGVGVGLVVDEFALLWNLNPDYYQPLSRFAAALVLFALFQFVYFRSLYLAVGRRMLAWVRP